MARPGKLGPTALDSAQVWTQLRQVRAVLADAVGKLTASFDTLRRESSAQRGLMDALVTAMERRAGVTGDPGRLSVREFAHEVGAVLQKLTGVLVAVGRESEHTVGRIDRMTAQFDEIFRRLEQVNDISEATFVLSVNASIQAAHAKGGHGQAFAVIASNVRDLARKTQLFNSEIAEQLDQARVTIDDTRASMCRLALASRDLKLALESKQRVEEMRENVVAFEAFTKETIASANGSAVRIEAAACQAVTALQFEDIVEQILSNAQARLLGRGHEVSSSSEPVHQTSLAPGDIELF
jgi:methyl-accepting chemotaxis protein